ncbi:MAG: hypothetical protein C0614_07475 [Desulfuromonas sp.]|nr:MAG: hypothetical protein C0614_07475 [Desulfuromonas sp.]
MSGPVVGAIAKLSYRELTLRLNPGDSILFYTDGVTEAMNTKQEFYGEESLVVSLETLQNLDSEHTIKSVIDSVHRHVLDAPQSDDIEMLCIRFLGNNPIHSR